MTNFRDAIFRLVAFFVALVTLAVAGHSPADAAVLMVGAGKQFSAPSDAIRTANPGDTIRIDPGSYFDCAVLTADRLTIEGTDEGTILTDKICQGKAIFVVTGSEITIRNLTFTRARANDGNGAGIRAEGGKLTLENDRFIDNQDGVLSANNIKTSIVIRDSYFEHNGSCVNACAHGVYAGHIASLQIERTRFFNTQTSHDVKSRALRTILTANRLEDGPTGTASYKVDIPNGGSLIMTDNFLEKGPHNGNPAAAIMVGEEGVSQPTEQLMLKNNTFTNDGPPTTFIKNITATPAQLLGNKFKGPIAPLVGDGSVH